MSANLYRDASGVVGIPYPDFPFILEQTGGCLRLHANGVERAGRRFDFLSGFHQHVDSHRLAAITEWETIRAANLERKRGHVENSRENIGDASRDNVLFALTILLDQVLLFEHGLAARVIEG